MNIETERLILRQWTDNDRAPMAAIQGDPEVRRFYPAVASIDQVNADINLAIQRIASGDLHFHAAELKETGELAGLIGVARISDATRAAIPSHPALEIGWVLDKRCWGRGLASEGAQPWLDHAWRIGIPRIVAFTARINAPSQSVMRKIGMVHTPEDDFEHPRITAGHPLSAHIVYAIDRPVA